MKIESIFLISSLVLAIIIVVSTVIWFLKKEYKSIRWFPILKILESKEFIIMKLSKDIPRIIPFICFLGISFIILFLSLSPYKEKSIEEKKSKNVYVVLDLSPSIESIINIEDYKKIVKKTLISSLDKTDKVFLYTSTGEDYNINSENIDSILDTIKSFQRSGIKLGNFIKNIPIEDGIVLILSDNDAFSWSDFDIESFSKKTIVRKIFLSNKNIKEGNNNFFIKDVILIDRNSMYFSFRVSIETSFPLGEEKKGNIEVLYNNETINSMDWSFSKDRTLISLDIDVDTEVIKNSSIPLYFKLNLKESNEDLNLIKSDDSYRIYPDSYYSALIVSSTFGERLLDDYFFFVQKSLDSLGIHSKRIDTLKNIDTSKYSLLILEGREDILDFCPNKSYISQDQFIWLQPSIKTFFSNDSGSIYKNICRCVSYLTDDSVMNINQEPKYCSNIGSLEALSEYLKYSGAIQVGGNTGEEGNIAWMIKKNIDKDKSDSNVLRFKLLSWLIPISPIRQIGIDHGTFAMMVSSVLEANSFFNKDSVFPRITDLSENSWFYKKNLDYLNSNVPLSESLLKTVNIDNSFIVKVDKVSRYHDRIDDKNTNKEDDSDIDIDISNYSNLDFKNSTIVKNSYPIIIGSIFIVILLMLVEILYLLYIGVIKKRKPSMEKNSKDKKNVSNKFLLIFFTFFSSWFLLFNSSTGFSEISVNLISSHEYRSLSIEAISKELALRTSINDLSYKIDKSSSFEKFRYQPWIWVDSSLLIKDSSGVLKKDIEEWIRRGGFLIIEEDLSIEELKKMFSNFYLSTWDNIDANNEIMKSYYLLDYLPVCEINKTHTWKGFYFDNRLAAISIPYNYLKMIISFYTENNFSLCRGISPKLLNRSFINIMMMVLTTDYKNEQTHLPEILKRLR